MYTINKPAEGNGENVPIAREGTMSNTLWFAKYAVNKPAEGNGENVPIAREGTLSSTLWFAKT